MPRRPAERTLTGNGSEQTSALVRMNRYTEWKYTIQIDHGGSTTGATVELTLDNPEFNANPTWIDWASIDAVANSVIAALDFPVEAVRLKLDANGTDTVRMIVVEGGGEV